MEAEEWGPCAPQTLQELCLDTILNGLNTVSHVDDQGGRLLKYDIELPFQICEALVQRLHEMMVLNESTLALFSDVTRTRLRALRLRELCSDRDLGDDLFQKLLQHKPYELNIIGFKHIFERTSIQAINTYSQNLVSLHLGHHIFYNVMESETDPASGDSDPAVRSKDHILKCPKLRLLGLHGLTNELHASYIICKCIEPVTSQLTCLDLSASECVFEQLPEVGALSNLYSLILYNVELGELRPAFSIMAKLTKLRWLDLSRYQADEPHYYPRPEDHMRWLLPQLPHLTHLDLSGSNLAGFIEDSPEDQALRHKTRLGAKYERPQKCAVPGLEGGRRLEFLGLMGAAHSACDRPNLPADQVTGDANEAQVLLSIKTYIDRENMLETTLNNLFRIFRYEECVHQRTALEVILAAMYRHPADKHIQICGSASLFYIVKNNRLTSAHRALKQRIVRVLVTAMERHNDEATMMRNGSLTLCHFKTPQDVLFIYRRLVKVLLRMIDPNNRPESFTQRVGVYLLNSLVCQVDGSEKLLVGNFGAIEMMLRIISSMLEEGAYNEVMEIAWSTMWNVTDETAANCQRFIDNKGMAIFVTCLQTHPDRDELLRNMMGLLGNVAEVDFLRPHLMKTEYVDLFSKLLESASDGIEVSYNACGVLSHMMSDGQSAWSIQEPDRRSVLRQMSNAINRWKLKTRRNINYRSFEPILRLLRHGSAPESQHWAVWALSNLTKMYRSKYCPLLEREGGMELLVQVTGSHSHPPSVRAWAQQVIDRCGALRGENDYQSSGDEQEAEAE